jgi:hypothetical protein
LIHYGIDNSFSNQNSALLIRLCINHGDHLPHSGLPHLARELLCYGLLNDL